jgi:hypothetical protein
LAAFGLLALGLGTLIRRTAGAVATLIGVLIFLPAAVGALPAAWRDHFNPYLPSVAGQVVIGLTKFTPPATCYPRGPGSPCPAATPPWCSSPPRSPCTSGMPDRSRPASRLPRITWTAVTAAVMFALA